MVFFTVVGFIVVIGVGIIGALKLFFVTRRFVNEKKLLKKDK